MADSNNQSNITLPSLEEMQAAVETLPPVLPKNLESKPASSQPKQSNIQLANTPETTDTLEAKSAIDRSDFEEIKRKLYRYFPKILGIGLTLQSLRGIYNSVVFILVDYPALEQKLVAKQITDFEVSELTITMILMLISTVISLFFAMRLTFISSKAAKRANTVIGFILLVGNPFLHDFIKMSGLTEWLVGFFTQSVQTIHEAPQQVIENAPFLEQGLDGEIDPVWYK